MMKITGLSHLFKWQNLHNWWLTKYFFAPLYLFFLCTFCFCRFVLPALRRPMDHSQAWPRYRCLHLYFIITLLPLCAHILYFDAAKFSIKQFSLIYFTLSVVGMNMKK